tara:strand:- start:121 stop:753 length:633 start_codon:yes stop_codon:yes gene_type:complete
MTIDHPIFNQSIRIIQSKLGHTGLEPLQQQVLERLIHTTGDFAIKPFLQFSPSACEIGISALKSGAPILTDTKMAAAAISPMASRTLGSNIRCILEWSPGKVERGLTRSAIGMRKSWQELSRDCLPAKAPLVLIGSAPTALEELLDLLGGGANLPSLIIAMPVGFVGVLKSKKRLSNCSYPQIRLDGHRGGAALVAAATNALLRASSQID